MQRVVTFPDSEMHFELFDRGSRELVIFLGGARNTDAAPPRFAGRHICNTVGVSSVHVSDPAYIRDNRIKLAWYGGTSGTPLQRVLPGLVTSWMAEVRAAKLIFVGGSGGGFASIYYAAKMPGSAALVWNPQTDIMRYNKEQRRMYGSLAFDVPENISEQKLRRSIDVDVLGRIPSRLHIMQNWRDHHVDNHFNPYLRSLGLDEVGKASQRRKYSDHNLSIFMDDWGPGHSAPHRDCIASELAALLQENAVLVA